MMIAHSAGTEATAQTCCGRNCDSIPNMQADEQEATTGITTPSKSATENRRPVGKSGSWGEFGRNLLRSPAAVVVWR